MNVQIPVAQVTSKQLRTVLEVVCRLTDDPDVQLSLITRALLVGAKTLNIPKATIIRELEKAWDTTEALKPGFLLRP